MSFLSRSLSLISALVLAQAALAQTTFTFVVDQGNSNFTWTGTSTLGPIVGNPSNQFQLLGTQNVDLAFQSGAQPFATGAFTTGGSVTTNGPIHGKVTGAFGITLATIDVNNLVMTASAPTFTVGAGGAFSATMILTTLSGQMVVTPLLGTPSTTDLTGNTSAPTAVNGTLTLAGSNFHMVGPVNSTFPFSDPTTGASGSITLTGTITANYAFMKGFCAGDGAGVACPCGNNSPIQGRGCVHSSGQGAQIAANGLPSLTSDTLVLTGSSQPAGTLGLYFQGTAAAGTGSGAPFGDGLLCVGGSIVRLGVKAAPAGTSSYPIAGDPSISVQGLVASAPGTRTYQLWYRDAAAYCSASTFNLTNGAEVLWLP